MKQQKMIPKKGLHQKYTKFSDNLYVVDDLKYSYGKTF